MPCLPLMASPFASTGLGTHHAPLGTHSPTFTAAASVVSPIMGLAAANPMPDPRQVVTPLNTDQVEALLCKYNINSTWNHIIMGLHEGFDVGIQEQLSHSYIFPQSQFISVRPQLYFFLHLWGTNSGVILGSLSSRGSRGLHWTISDITAWPSTQTSLGQLPYDSRYVLSMELTNCHLHQCRHRPRQFSHCLGLLQSHISLDPIFASWLCCSFI